MIALKKETSIVKRIKICEILKSLKPVIQTRFDIVKAHGGELKVETKENDGSMFIVQKPN